MVGDIELIASDDQHDVLVTVSPTDGGRVRQITVDGVGLLATTAHADRRSTHWGLFPMAPWAGRIRNGRFTFKQRDVTLELNHQDGDSDGGGTLIPARSATSGPLPEQDRNRHAIHGTTFSRPWTVHAREPTRLEMSCDLDGALAWPFAGVARQTLDLSPTGIEFEMSVESVEGSVFPASIGWHPWFVKPDLLDFRPVAMYQRDEFGLPTGRLVEIPEGPWDDCFVNHDPVRLHYDRATVPAVTVSSPVDHWVVYDGTDHATCVEPQTGPPDAPTLRPKVVAPGAPLRITMHIGWG